MTFDTYFVLAGLASLLVGLSKGGLPTVGMLAVPLLSLFMSPIKAAVLLLPIYIISDGVSVWLYRKNFSAANLKILLPAGILGVFIGWLTASITSDSAVKLMIGLMGVGFCLNTWLRRTPQDKQPVNRKKGWFWGTVAGFTSFISHAGGPPFQIYMLPQRLPKIEFAGTATLMFAVINAAKILPYQQLQPYSIDDLMRAADLIPFALVGTVLGAYLTKKIADVWFYRLVQASLFLVSIKLIADVVL
ncbi:MAG: sulfite exporter TauE/SafE family protein [Limnohabitans sp.]|nr:sulfite exporter TauE/SafE family protein [Limnohabitans sp.]